MFLARSTVARNKYATLSISFMLLAHLKKKWNFLYFSFGSSFSCNEFPRSAFTSSTTNDWCLSEPNDRPSWWKLTHIHSPKIQLQTILMLINLELFALFNIRPMFIAQCIVNDGLIHVCNMQFHLIGSMKITTLQKWVNPSDVDSLCRTCATRIQAFVKVETGFQMEQIPNWD